MACHAMLRAVRSDLPIKWIGTPAICRAPACGGFSKLRHSGIGWIASDNLAMLLLRQQYHLSDGEPLTTWGIWVANHAWLARAMAAASVSVETLFPLALFNRYVRRLLVPAGLGFLVGIRLLMGPTFEQFMLCYVFWVPWDRVLYNAPLYAAVALRRAADLRGGLSTARAGARFTAGD